MTTTDMIGIAGVTLLLLAFLANLIGIVAAGGRVYLTLNLLGAGLAGASAALIPFWPFVVLEGVWALVAAVGLLRLRRRPVVA